MTSPHDRNCHWQLPGKPILLTMRQYLIAAAALLALQAQGATELALRTPGGAATTCKLTSQANGGLMKPDNGATLPLKVFRTVTTDPAGEITTVTLEIKADQTCWFNISETEMLGTDADHNSCEFYMPGFWYHHNLRSPKEAPSFHTSDSWQVREDRLSSPLTGIYEPASGKAVTVLRINTDDHADCVLQNLSGDVLLTGHTSVGSTGFRNIDGKPALVYSYPYVEAPRRYIRKLTLIDPVRTFERIDKGDTRTIKWQIRRSQAKDYSDFVADVWNYTYDTLSPATVDTGLDTPKAKEHLASYFVNSYVDKYDLKYYSGAGMRTDDCANTDQYQIGFVGRTLLNAFNAHEYGLQNNRQDLVANAENIFSSALEHGFTDNGFFRESVRLRDNRPVSSHSIRRQSEGVFAMLNWLEAERKQGRKHPEWDARIRTTLDKMLTLQQPDGSFPRKFTDALEIVDPTGGSTPCATLPMTMAYKYFNDKRYLESARATAKYLETELIDKADYFSSTLDANCEDKEASFYASTALYYLTHCTKGKEQEHYMDLCRKSAYFCLSWYYMWDVPFAAGQMLGDVGFKSRGWGNVSVENNHIDVYIFEFAAVLDRLAEHFSEPRLSGFSNVIKTSMLQLMPTQDNMFDIGKRGYYPEVVQHTTWDYGRNGKGFYNDIFAPGWTVASLWQMLCPDRVDRFFAKK